METNKHTPTPWKIVDGLIFDVNEEILIRAGNIAQNKATAERIVACVNALAGIEDPEKWVEDMKTDAQQFDLWKAKNAWFCQADGEYHKFAFGVPVARSTFADLYNGPYKEFREGQK